MSFRSPLPKPRPVPAKLTAKKAAPNAQIHAAARAAGAHDFIAALPDGYGTSVGQRGRMLSGGQRQRIAIARALLRDAPVLILDEPTTGLDPAAARQLADLLRVAGAGHTTIVITHDPGLAATADEVLTIGGHEAGGLRTPSASPRLTPQVPGRAAS